MLDFKLGVRIEHYTRMQPTTSAFELKLSYGSYAQITEPVLRFI
ncbi:hypothetical protein F0Z19_3977 [Vibrio cyclitrophicus]|uniref:Uncharacterized protein n=1 Tax=Vibrio coralliirubri TaxID=1516159 RepID=A0A0T7DZ30_9VIBR|nr:hypothetical protein F0Z19_3977 [Vibrio cyclitrophicus]CAH7176670.1 conserved hypothetical protein [Vibrio chagasii]CDS96984.1 hypothetical protein VCR15J5_100024 [Vibrio crassostreae]CDT20551.1 hypothetical protein VCR4J2_270029 [Vibrio coralliirubri]CDT44129.1 hypothetical protein VCRLGP8_360025 [Vibrio crassostreae]